MCNRSDSRFAPSQWETALLCNDVSYWLGASLKLALYSAVHIWWLQSKSDELSRREQPTFVLVMAKWRWRSRPMAPIFNNSPENHKIHVWCKFIDFSSNLGRVIVLTRQSLQADGQTDKQTDGWTDGYTKATTIPFRPERSRGKNWKQRCFFFSSCKFKWCCCLNY